MLSLPFPPAPRYTFLLTSEGIELTSDEALGAVVRQPIAPGVLGPRSPNELSGYHLLDPEALREALHACLQQLGRPVKRAHLALDGLLLRQVNLPLSYLPPEAELRTAVQTEAERYVVFSGTEVAFDFAVLSQSETSLSLLVAAGRQDYLEDLASVFHSLGVTLESMEPLPFALIRGLDEEWLTQEAPCGLITLLSHQLQVSAWANGKLESWRTLYLDAAALRQGDAQTLAEARIELQRTLMDAPPERWVLVNTPESLDEVLTVRPGFTLRHRQALGQPGDEQAAHGASQYHPEAFPFGFNLLANHAPTRSGLSPAKTGLLATAIGILALALVANLVITHQQQALSSQIAQMQAETERLQEAMQKPDRSFEARQAAQKALTRSSGVARVFEALQEATPHDVWLSQTQISEDSALRVEGYSLSRTSPLAFAKTLGNSPELAGIQVPELAETDWKGSVVYRFRLDAEYRPQGASRL